MADVITKGPYHFAIKDKEHKRFILANIAKLEPGEDKTYLLTFKSIRENTPKKKMLDVTIKITSYSKLCGLGKVQLDGMPYKYFEMKKAQYFQFQRRKILIGIGPNPKVVWLLAKDVCSILDIQNVKEAFDSTHYDAKTILPVTYSDGFKKNEMIISDYAVRQLTKKAKNTKADQFEEWISNNVIPWFKLNCSTDDEK